MQPYFEINLGFKTDVGRFRKNNEDYIKYFIPTDENELKQNGCLFIVADGVGGAAKGEIASHFAGDTVIYEYYNNTELPPAERLTRAMQKASREIYEHSQENGNFTRMATTMVAALILQNNLIVAHVGDSRLYLIREGKIKQLTRDHSVVAEMVRNGAMTEEEARTSKAKNRLSRSIGGEADVHVDVSNPVPLDLGDRILLCSDGLTRYLDGEDLKAAAQKGDVETLTKDMVKFANEHGGVDNISVILLEIVEKAKIKPKKSAARQTPPEKLGWDEAQTEYPQVPVKQKRKIPVWVMIASGVIISSIAMLFLNDHSDKNVVPTIDSEMQSITKIVIVVTSEPTNLSMPDASEQVSASNTAVIPDENQGQWECVYEIQAGDVLVNILDEFRLYYPHDERLGKGTSSENKYSYYSNCDINDRLIPCTQKNEYPDNEEIGLALPEWIIIYSSSEDGDILYKNENNEELIWGKENCLASLGGYVYEIGGNK
jgi:protein phosphatase